MFNLNGLLPTAKADPRKRFRISAFQVQALEDVFKNNPRPCKEIQEEVAQQLGLPYRTVTIWFQNRRAKAKTAGEPLAGHVFQWKPPVVAAQPAKPKEKPKEKPPAPTVPWPDQPFLAQDWPYLDSASYVSNEFAPDFAPDFVTLDFMQPMEPFPLFGTSVASLSTQDSGSFYATNFYSQSLPHFVSPTPFAAHPAQSAPALPLPAPSTRPAKSCQNDAMFFSMRS